MGRRLATLMVDAIEDRPGKRRIVMPTRLIVRATA
jgi:DNA-binding LacI/PurR family transcriptional regulator